MDKVTLSLIYTLLESQEMLLSSIYSFSVVLQVVKFQRTVEKSKLRIPFNKTYYG